MPNAFSSLGRLACQGTFRETAKYLKSGIICLPNFCRISALHSMKPSCIFPSYGFTFVLLFGFMIIYSSCRVQNMTFEILTHWGGLGPGGG